MTVVKESQVLVEARERLRVYGYVVTTDLAPLTMVQRTLDRMEKRGECRRVKTSNLFVRPDVYEVVVAKLPLRAPGRGRRFAAPDPG